MIPMHKNNSEIQSCSMECKVETTLEERLRDIDEFIQSELGFSPLTNISEPSSAADVHNLNSLVREMSNGLLEHETNSFTSASIEPPNKAREIEVEVQIIGLKDVYDKKTKKTKEGFEYRLEDSEVTVVVQASGEVTNIRAYTQRCAEAAIRTHDTVGPVELDVNVVQCDSRCRVATVDIGSVYRTQQGDPVYWLEKAEVAQRNKWELIIALEFSSGLKGTVHSEPYRVTTKASYKMRKSGEVPSCGHVQRIFRKFTWSDYHSDVPNMPCFPNTGIKQEINDQDACSLSGGLMQISFMTEEENASEHLSTDSSMTDFSFVSDPLAGRRILFQNQTSLDRQMVTRYYKNKPSIHYVVEQPELPGLLKLVGKRCTVESVRRKANGHKSAEEDFWWACGHCFFERRKKSTIKAHVIQKVCQKSMENKISRRRLPRHQSQSDVEDFNFQGYTWKNSLSV